MFDIDPNDPTPIYAQLERAIRAAVASGRLTTGEKLPTVRQLAIDLHVNPNTVARVYAELERAGVVSTTRGVGTFVRTLPPPPAPLPRRDRERELRPLVDRLVADAAAIGIPLSDVVQYVKGLETRPPR